MASKVCKYCGAINHKNTKICPVCGRKQTNPVKSFFKAIFTIILVIVLLVVGLIVYASVSETGSDLAENVFTKIVGVGLLSKKGGASEIVSSLKGYEDIYNTYSEKIRKATPSLIEEYKNEAAKNTTGISGLAELANQKVSKLAEICTEGTEKMAQHMMLKGSDTYDEYAEWGEKLYAVYQEEAEKIMSLYMNSALG